jgi:hypothetical protein
MREAKPSFVAFHPRLPSDVVTGPSWAAFVTCVLSAETMWLISR